MASYEWLREAKSSDTLFILGTGPSVLEFTDAHWSEIGTANSLGLNNWILHDFVPTFYSGEFADDREVVETYVANLGRVVDRYQGVRSYFRLRKGTARHVPVISMFGGRVLLQQPIQVSTRPQLREALASVDVDTGRLVSRVPNLKSSLAAAVFVAAAMSYRSVVLCGVDLIDASHFYDFRPDELRARGLRLPPREAAATVHPTLDPGHTGGLTVSDVLAELAAQPAFPSLTMAHDRSPLTPLLGVHEWGARR